MAERSAELSQVAERRVVEWLGLLGLLRTTNPSVIWLSIKVLNVLALPKVWSAHGGHCFKSLVMPGSLPYLYNQCLTILIQYSTVRH